MAAVLACGPGAVLSHAPAGQLQGFVDSRERHAIHISVPPGRTPRPRGLIVHRPRALESQDTRQHLGIPCTTVTRTVWDMAATSPPRALRRAFERADGRGWLDRRRLTTLLASSPTHKGAGRIRQLLASGPLPLTEVRSWLEELLMLICSEHSLPIPATNVPVHGYEVDFYWPAAAFVVEADGSDHLDPDQRDSDNERDFALGRAGILVRRYSYKAMGKERKVAEEVLSILTARLSP
jgi:hypothetical protein